MFYRTSSGAILHFRLALMFGTVRAAEKLPMCFHSMPDNANATMVTGGGERVDGAFKTVKGMGLPTYNNLKSFVVAVPADFTTSH
jgi:hypothetical protein